MAMRLPRSARIRAGGRREQVLALEQDAAAARRARARDGKRPRIDARHHRLARARLSPITQSRPRPRAQREIDDRSTAFAAGRRPGGRCDRQPFDVEDGSPRSSRTQPRIQRLVQAFADEVDRQHGEQDRDARESCRSTTPSAATARPAPMMQPQLITLGSPRPRNDEPGLDQDRACRPSASRPTMIDDSAVRQDVREDDARVAHAQDAQASTNSRSRSAMNSPRTRRAMAARRRPRWRRCRCAIDGVRIATSRIANMKDGMVWKISVKRISTTSTRPPIVAGDAADRARRTSTRRAGRDDADEQRGARAVQRSRRPRRGRACRCRAGTRRTAAANGLPTSSNGLAGIDHRREQRERHDREQDDQRRARPAGCARTARGAAASSASSMRGSSSE